MQWAQALRTAPERADEGVMFRSPRFAPLVLSFAFLGCRSTPLDTAQPAASTGRLPPACVAREAREASAHRPSTSPPLPTPLPATVLTDRQLSATVQGHWGAAQTRDHSWIVQVPYDGSAIVLSVASAVGAVSSALNVPGDQTANLDGHNVPLPLSVRPGDSLILLSGSEGGNSAAPLGHATANGAIDEAMAIVFVPYETSSAYYRPPAIGRRDDPIVYFLRTWSPIPEALTDLSRLPNVVDLDELYRIPGQPRPGDANRIDPTAWGAARPTIAESLAIHERFEGDFYSDWLAAGRVPWTQHQGYGTFVMAALSTAALLLCSTAPVTEKAPLAHAIVQRGLDQLGAVADGKLLYPLGGHCWGRKVEVVVCGHLLGIDLFADPTPLLGPRFAEDSYHAANWWFAPGSPQWTSTWPFSLDAGFEGSRVASAPSTWGDPHAPNHDTWGWAFAYYGQVVPAALGATLACVLMGRGDSLNHHMVQVGKQHMQGPPESVRTQMTALGISDPNWGGDYGGPTGFAASAWRHYGPID